MRLGWNIVYHIVKPVLADALACKLGQTDRGRFIDTRGGSDNYFAPSLQSAHK